MHKVITTILVLVFVVLLVLIRFYEGVLFYDPYLTFFQNDYLYIDSPRREIAKLVGFTTLRYALNTVISLAILFVVFKDKSIIKFSALIYVIAFLVLMVFYLYFVVNPRQEDYYLFFNIRRFLIQPILLILLLPAFYYHKIKN
ncbi:exosortase F system-associated protein [Algibacter amylolyticus]|uniref:Exosortase F system-associated protein n=1 Tax=Algibacter amylolyticus TaxID=1608400 RepID=A0A5M7BC86_9FLAO|nr:exosortase F system-associated protein [Algibacter amylolyticus]KAA5826290.1 exosortase F system-associated protein [Algibacter amylolyticus]MBB5268493.1 exosortase F-associated protein [Algibacter amylolyticus]TSJ80328.1 exosortase F system-associated protein [Algibacter amylolyticus]